MLCLRDKHTTCSNRTMLGFYHMDVLIFFLLKEKIYNYFSIKIRYEPKPRLQQKEWVFWLFYCPNSEKQTQNQARLIPQIVQIETKIKDELCFWFQIRFLGHTRNEPIDLFVAKRYFSMKNTLTITNGIGKVSLNKQQCFVWETLFIRRQFFLIMSVGDKIKKGSSEAVSVSQAHQATKMHTWLGTRTPD